MQKIVELGKELTQQEELAKGNKDTTPDDFGLDDQDWEVYRDIQKDGFSEDEEDDMQSLQEIEEKIAQLDSEFNSVIIESGPQGYRPSTPEDY